MQPGVHEIRCDIPKARNRMKKKQKVMIAFDGLIVPASQAQGGMRRPSVEAERV